MHFLLAMLLAPTLLMPFAGATTGVAPPDCQHEVQPTFAVIVSCVVGRGEAVIMIGNYGRYQCRSDPESVIIVQQGNGNNATC